MNAKHILSTLFRNILLGALIGGGLAGVSGLFGGNTGPDGKPLSLGESLSTGAFIGAIIGGLVALYRLESEYREKKSKEKKESKGGTLDVFADVNRWAGQQMQEFEKLNTNKSLPTNARGKPAAITSEKPKYTDIGDVMGNCMTCGREVYAVPGSVTVKLVMSDQEDKIKATAMWCPKCNTLYCMGCAQNSNQKCPTCEVGVVDYYNR